MHCLICGTALKGAVCPSCGFDESLCAERYPTLQSDLPPMKALWVRRKELIAGLRGEIREGLRQNAGLEAECDRAEKENLALREEQDRLTAENDALRAECDRLRRSLPALQQTPKPEPIPERGSASGPAETFTANGLICAVEPDDSCAVIGAEELSGEVLFLPLKLGDREVTRIAPEAFRGQDSLKNVVVAHTVRRIDAGAFRDCGQLRSIQLFYGTEIGPDAFAGCRNLISVIYPGKLPKQKTLQGSIDRNAFDGSNPRLTFYAVSGSEPIKYANRQCFIAAAKEA